MTTHDGNAAHAECFDVLVIGAGFGGLGAAIALAEQGARVCLCETLRYPGGCASTFTRHGFRFDAGATLVSGLAKAQLFGSWLARYAPDTRIDWMDPLIQLRAADLCIDVGRDRARLVERFCAMPGAPVSGIRAFFARQRSVADILWALFDDPTLLPPFDLRTLARHAGRLLDYALLIPLMGRSLASVLAAHGVATFSPLRLYVDALCQITVQCSAAEAEAPFALAAMDYCYRGTAHVHGGVGRLAEALLSGAAQAGADVRLSTRVTGLRRQHDGDGKEWVAKTRHGEVRAKAVVANLLPAALEGLLDEDVRASRKGIALKARAAPYDDAWGAAMLYAVARAPSDAADDAHHLQLVADAARALQEGNHLFVSISSASETDRAPLGRRTLTMSTHVPLATLRDAEPAQYVERVQATMRQTLALRAPEWSGAIEHVMPASPRTFARFVGRPGGAVGGLPRATGLSNYGSMGPEEVIDRVWLVGDSVFPGQSALATAIGGVRTASVVTKSLR